MMSRRGMRTSVAVMIGAAALAANPGYPQTAAAKPRLPRDDMVVVK